MEFDPSLVLFLKIHRVASERQLGSRTIAPLVYLVAMLENAPNQRYWQSHDVEVTSINFLHKTRGASLDSVGACLIHGLARGHVLPNFAFLQRSKHDLGGGN